jgi:hypothetical protein
VHGLRGILGSLLLTAFALPMHYEVLQQCNTHAALWRRELEIGHVALQYWLCHLPPGRYDDSRSAL